MAFILVPHRRPNPNVVVHLLGRLSKQAALQRISPRWSRRLDFLAQLNLDVSPQLLAAYMVKMILGPSSRKRSSSHKRGAWRTRRLVNWIGSFRTIGNDLRSRLPRSAVVRILGDLVNQPSPDRREYMVLATARTKDRRLRSREPFPRAQKRLELGPLAVRFGLTIAICEDPTWWIL